MIFAAQAGSLSLWAAVWFMLNIWRSAEAITRLTRSHKSPYTDGNIPLSVSRLTLSCTSLWVDVHSGKRERHWHHQFLNDYLTERCNGARNWGADLALQIKRTYVNSLAVSPAIHCCIHHFCFIHSVMLQDNFRLAAERGNWKWLLNAENIKALNTAWFSAVPDKRLVSWNNRVQSEITAIASVLREALRLVYTHHSKTFKAIFIALL